MKETIKHHIKKIPAMYRLISTGHRYCMLTSRYLRYLIFGTSSAENEWAARNHTSKRDDWGTGHNDWIKGYWDSIDHPHRVFLAKHISKHNPSSILEIGCNCGPNLRLLAKKFPHAQIAGVEINPLAVRKGNEWLTKEGLTNVRIFEGRADDLKQFKDKSFDIVFTDAVLIYIGPDKIRKVVNEMVRVARKGLVFTEWNIFEKQNDDPSGLGVYYNGYWKRNYNALLKHVVGEKQICITKIPASAWPDKSWSMVGAIIDVELEAQ